MHRHLGQCISLVPKCECSKNLVLNQLSSNSMDRRRGGGAAKGESRSDAAATTAAGFGPGGGLGT